MEVGLSRALRLPMVPSETGKLLRKADRLLSSGKQDMIVGTKPVVAHALEANAFIRDCPNTTLKFDMAQTAVSRTKGPIDTSGAH